MARHQRGQHANEINSIAHQLELENIVTVMNNAPALTTLLPNQSSAEGEAVSFALPANALTAPDGDALTLSATLLGGAALPKWLVFDAVAGNFSGTPPQDFNGN